MAIIIIDNFQVDISNPIDNRFVVGSQSIASGPSSMYPTPFYAYRSDIVYRYPGLRIWDFNDNVPYVWDGAQWINENTTGALVQNAATGNTGFKDYIVKFENNQTLLTKSSIYDSISNIGIGLTGSDVQPFTSTLFPPYDISTGFSAIGLHVKGNIRAGIDGNPGWLIGKINADYIVDGTLNLVRIQPASSTVGPSFDVTKTYLLKDLNGTISWDLVSNIVPIPGAANSTLSTSLTGIYGNGGTVYQGLSVDPITGAGTYLFKPLLSAGLQITDNVDHIIIESKVGLTSSTGIPVYTGLNTDKRHVFKNITSGSLDVTTDGDNVKVELYVDVNDKSFYVNGNYTGPEEKGTIAKPYKHIESALYAFIGRGTRWNPEWKGRGKIILLSYIATSFNMTAWWNHTDVNGNVNQIKDNAGNVINSQINTIGWLSVNHVNIDGQGNTLEYQGTTPYWISTEKFINSYDSTPGTFINNTWSAQNLYYPAEQAAAPAYTIKSSATQRLNIDLIINIKNITIVSSTHELAYHLNYGYDLFVPQPVSQIKFINCIMYDYGMYGDLYKDFNGVKLDTNDQVALAIANAGYDTNSNFNGQYIKATNKWNSIQTHFGSEIWIENRIRPTGVGTGFSIPTNKYMIRVEGRNWNNEGFFEMTDCNLVGSSSTMILVKNTSVGFLNLKISRNGSFISYGEDGAYNGLGKDYYNHQIELNYHDPSTAYAYSPYSNISQTVKKAKAWVNRYMPKKNLFYIRMEGDNGTINGGIATNAWCRVVNLNIENSFATTTWRNNQRGRTPLNSQAPPYNTQTWVNDATIPNSYQINYNQTAYFKSQIGGSDALFKIDGNSYFRVEGGYVYGEQANNLIHKSQYASVDFIDCNFDLLECIDTYGQEWNSSDNAAKKGAFKLVNSPTLSLSTNRSISLYSSKVNFVIFKQGSPYPTQNVGGNQFYDALRDGKGWASDYIYPYSPDSTINKVSFSSTTPMIPATDTITSAPGSANNLALDTNVGYNSYKLIPGNKYYDAAGKQTVVKVPTLLITNLITLPVEFGSLPAHTYVVNPP
jgi:hypothetical protein